MSAEEQSPYRRRQERVRAELDRQGIDLAVLADFEGMRNRSVRYLSGQPMDAALFLSRRESLLAAWDVPLAERLAAADRILPYAQFERSLVRAVGETARALAAEKGGGPGLRVEVSAGFSYPDVQELAAALPGGEVLCRRDGLDRWLLEQRSRKDAAEIEALRQAGRVTDRILSTVEERLASSKRRPSELELALLIEGEARSLGAEGTGFETLAASPERSFALHPHPAFTAAAFGGPGFSMLDFGVCWAGYTSDVTLTAVRRPLSRLQERMREAVEEAYRVAVALVRPGAVPLEIARRIEELLRDRGFVMPHSLGHGIGLDAHESPLLRARAEETGVRLAEGMVLTIEPGLYAPLAGGIRLENDLLVTGGGCEPLTHSRLIELPD